MCESLSGLREALADLAAGFEPGQLAPSELQEALGQAGAIEKLGATLAGLIAARLAQLGKPSVARQEAARSLARAAGTTLREAQRAIGAAEEMAAQPELAAAARSGQLSRAQAGIVAGAAAANPAATAGLLAKASHVSLWELAGEAARATAASGPSWEQARRARSLRSYTDGAGVWHLHAQGPPEQGARVMANLQPIADKLFDQARSQGRRENPEALGFDALVELATSGGGGMPPAEVVFRVDAEAFFRGYPAEGEVTEVAGFGPVSTQAVRDVLEHGTTFVKAVVTRGVDVTGVVHLGRRPSAHQATALGWLYPTCAAEGCGVLTDWCQTDHRTPWAEAHFTVLSQLDRLCKAHHALKTYQGWSLVEGKGKRPFVPPGDPRHPRHAQRAVQCATGPPLEDSSRMPTAAQAPGQAFG